MKIISKESLDTLIKNLETAELLKLSRSRVGTSCVFVRRKPKRYAQDAEGRKMSTNLHNLLRNLLPRLSLHWKANHTKKF